MSTTNPKIHKLRMTDSAMAEVRRVKIELAKRFDFDVSAMLRDSRIRQNQSGRKIVDRSNAAW